MEKSVIFIGLGSNLPSQRYGDPAQTCQAALDVLAASGVEVLKVSRWYRSAPVPASDQPWFVNGVAMVNTDLTPAALLALLHQIEQDFGRERRARDEARVIDLDILAYGDLVSAPGTAPVLPHPRLAQRAFVVLPLAEIAPHWRHPASGLSIEELAAGLPVDQVAEPLG
jgi:2-amino-4-hydroxy-6-hydroxymethyldihydropteridine diphosphokinase